MQFLVGYGGTPCKGSIFIGREGCGCGREVGIGLGSANIWMVKDICWIEQLALYGCFFFSFCLVPWRCSYN